MAWESGRSSLVVSRQPGVNVYQQVLIKVSRAVVLAAIGLGIVVAIFQGHGGLVLMLGGLTLWLAAVLCLLVSAYHWRRVACRYYWRPEGQGCSYFEVRKRDRVLRRRIRVTDPGTASREVVENGGALEETADLIPSSAQEFARHWKQRSSAFMLLMLQVRLCLVAVLCIAVCIVLFKIADASFKSLRFRYSDFVLGVPLYTAWIAGGLHLVPAALVHFRRPTVWERIAAVVLGLVGLLILCVLAVGSAQYTDEVMMVRGMSPFVLVSVFVLVLLGILFAAIPYYYVHSLRHWYYTRLEDREIAYLEFRRKNHRLCRRLRVRHGVSPSREVVEDGEALARMAELIPSDAREFARQWKQWSAATRLFVLQLRASAVAVLSCALCLTFVAAAMSGLIRGTGQAWEFVVGALMIGALLLGGLQAIVAVVLQFKKPSVWQRVIALVVAPLIPIAVGLTYFVLTVPAV